VFRLTPGEDCEDAPLDGAALVAQAEAGEPGAAERTEPMTVDRAEPPARSSTIETAALAPLAATLPETVAARPAGPSPARVPTITQALPAASPSPSGAAVAAEALPPAGVVTALPVRPEPAAEPPAEIRPAQAGPVESERAQIRPAGTGPSVIASIEPPAAQPAASVAVPARPGQELAIVFPTNSSYFPPGAGQQLRGLLRALAQDGAYQVVLRSSISGSQKVVGAESTDEAMRYNKWLAERRLERVRDWLGDNAAGRELTFTEDYRAGDESRQVEIEVRPAG
jgi:hypothetical protein